MRVHLFEANKQHNARLIQPQKSVLWNSALDNKLKDVASVSDKEDIATLLAKYDTLLGVFYKYPWLSGSLMQIAKTISGSRYGVVPKDFDVAMSSSLDKVVASINNYMEGRYSKRRWDNIKDAVTASSKIKDTVIFLSLFGVAGWETIRDDRGAPVGFDFINGIIVPNVDEKGYFKTPAWKVYRLTGKDRKKPIPYNRPDDIVLFITPALTGELVGRSYLEPLMEHTIPADIYASKSYLFMHKNHNSPAGIWIIKDADDDSFNEIDAMIRAAYRGVNNYNTSAVTTNKDIDFKEFRAASKDDAPYLEGRNFAKGEIAAITGTPTAKLGVSEDMDKSDLQTMKREFYETTVRPITKIIEETITEQVIFRYFGSDKLRFQFEQPDFLTTLERATASRRWYESNVLNPNEIRQLHLNLPPRPDGGNLFRDEMLVQRIEAKALTGEDDSIEKDGVDSEQGGPPSDRIPGSENQEREPGDIGSSNASEAPRVERRKITLAQHTDIIEELNLWERVTQEMVLGTRKVRPFEFKAVPKLLAESIQEESGMLWTMQNMSERLRLLSLIAAAAREIITNFFDVVVSLERD